MNYIKTEWYKIKKSWQSKTGYLLVFALVLVIVTGYKVRVDFEISSFDIVLVSLGNIINSLVLHFVVVLVSSLLFAGEFTGKTYKYIMVRPVSPFQIFLGKLFAVWYYAARIMVFVAVFSFFAGMIFWGSGSVHGQNYTVLDHGLLRIFLFYTGTWVNLFFIITLSGFCAVILKNQLSTVITTMGLFLILIFSTNIKPDFFNYTPIPYFNLRIFLTTPEIKFGALASGLVITLVYSLTLAIASYFYLKNKDILI